MRARGPSDAERLALDFITVTATGTVISAPCFIYSMDYTLSDTSVSGLFSFGDTTASADLAKESTRMDIKSNCTVASGTEDLHDNWTFMPPLIIQNTLCFNVATGIRSVSFSYLAAS